MDKNNSIRDSIAPNPDDLKPKALNIQPRKPAVMNVAELEQRTLKIEKTKEVTPPVIANEADYAPIVLTEPKSRKSLFIGIILFFIALFICFYFLIDSENKLKREYEEATRWNKSVGNFLKAYPDEEQFHQNVQSTWLRLVDLDALEMNQDFTLAKEMMDVVSSLGKKRDISSLVSLLSLKTPDYRYFRANANQQSLKLLDAKKDALLIEDSHGLLYTDTFLYARFYRGDSREWCHSFEKIGDRYRLSTYQPTTVLRGRTLESFENTAVFINDRRLSKKELAKLLPQK